MTPWQRLLNLMKLEQKDIYRILIFAAFAGLVGLSLPLGVQATINLVVGGQFNASIILLIALVLLGVIFIRDTQRIPFLLGGCSRAWA